MRRAFSFNKPTLLLCFLIQFLGFLLLGLPYIPTASQAHAQAPITSSGLNTQVSQPISLPGGQTQYNITGGTRPGSGGNLFHSFGDFNVPNNNIANLLNDAGLATSNILGRVTGGNISNIFGTIQTTGFGNANLFLMNPAGFLFGPNATVNVGGMVSFTSADYLRLADGKLFNAAPNPNADALLSTAPVAAYGFLGSNPGAITVQGSQLSVTPGQSISLVGGNITIQSGKLDDGTVQTAKLSAPGGQINLASVASPGEVIAGTLDYAPNVNGQSFGALGSSTISQQSVIDVSGDGGGTVLIRGGNFVLDNSTISANITGPGPLVNGVESIGGGIDIAMGQKAEILTGSLIQTNVIGNATPGVTYGGTHIKANRIEIIGDPAFDFDNGPFTEIHSDVAVGSTGGSSGSIKLEANSIYLQDFVTLQADTNGKGNGGDIILHSTGNLELNGSTLSTSSGFDADPGSIVGNAGNIELTSTSGNILMTNAPFISSQAFEIGTVGHITVSAPAGGVILSDFQGLPGTLFTHDQGTAGIPGKGGIQITAKDLTIVNSGIQIDNFTSVQPGDLTVNLTGTLKLSGSDSLTTLLTTTRREARSANLNITAPEILLTGNSVVATDTFRNGDAGTLNILTQNLEVTNGAQIRSSSRFNPFPQPGVAPIVPSGAGGSINIQGLSGPAQSVLVDGTGSGILTNTQGTGTGGSINITTNSLTVQNSGTLSAATSGTAPSATGGAILVKADTVTLNSGGTMTATSTGPGAAGEVIVQGLASPTQSILIDGTGSGIFTDTHSTGAGGNISVNANSVTVQNGGSLSAVTSGTSPSATGGTITVDANQVQVNSGGLITAATTGAGAGGSININSGSTFSSNAGTVSSTAAQATGGGINVAAGQSVTMTNGASISASSTGAGNAGNIQINAGNQLAMANSTVTTEANQSGGGTIKITTTPSGTVELTNSKISASVLDGNGGGGSVNIDPQFVILQNSQILAQAVQGPGGNISITTSLLLPDSLSVISASSQFGQQGTISVQSPISPAGGKIIPLSQKPLIPTALLSQRCVALAGGNISSFTVAGRDSLPAEPGSWISSPLALSLSESVDGTATEAGPRTSSSEVAEEDIPLLSLRQIAPPGFLTQSFAVDSSAGCTS
jgi:filamentous hemagglutinin family protein